MRMENKLYAKEYPQLAQKEKLLADVVEGLRVKDDRIYEEIFNTSAPDMEGFSSLDFLMGLDSIPDSDIVSSSAARLDKLERSAGRVEDNFLKVMEAIGPGYPPAFIATSHHDFLRENAWPMYEHLCAHGIPARVEWYGSPDAPEVAHVFHVNILHPEARRCNDDEAAFFREFA